MGSSAASQRSRPFTAPTQRALQTRSVCVPAAREQELQQGHPYHDVMELLSRMKERMNASETIDVATTRKVQSNLLPKLQEIGFLGPGDLFNLQAHPDKPPRCLRELHWQVMQVTCGEPRMNREHMVSLLTRMSISHCLLADHTRCSTRQPCHYIIYHFMQ